MKEMKKSKILITSDIYAQIQYRDKIPTEPRAVVATEYLPEPVEKTEYSMEQVTKALKKISKHTIEDELNRMRKVADLGNRTQMADQLKVDAFVSIHMNTFSDPQYFGSQVFY